MKRGFRLFSAAILIAVTILGTALSQVGGESILSTPIKEVKADTQDVREVLRGLFKHVKVSYSISPEVQGTVTIHSRDVSFHVALTNVLQQVRATYRMEGGIVQIVPVRINVGGGPEPFSMIVPGSQAPVIVHDDRFLYVLQGDLLFKVSKSNMKTVATGKLGE